MSVTTEGERVSTYETAPDEDGDRVVVSQPGTRGNRARIAAYGPRQGAAAFIQPADAFPLAQAILDAAEVGDGADVTLRVEDDREAFRIRCEVAAGTTPLHAAELRRLAALALARARAIEAEPDPAVVEALVKDITDFTSLIGPGLARHLAQRHWRKEQS